MTKNPTYLFVVAAALVDQHGMILVQQRPEGKNLAGLWEFPGGKVEAGESPVEALVRELDEELDITVAADDLRPAGFASEPLADRFLILLLYICDKWSGVPKNLESAALSWASVDGLRQLPMPPADMPLVEQLALILQPA